MGWNPVPKMITSAGTSVPSRATSPVGVTEAAASGINVTSGLARAGSHLLVSRIRLQPIEKSGVSALRVLRSRMWRNR